MEENTFIPPPEAPVFEPTEEEFQDPLSFIDKIRPYVEKTGICKIRPPPDWQPPFSVDVEKFRFTPRVQKLNELEATTRVKFNFLDAIAKFWELQGTSLKIPMVDRRNLDIFKLYKTVHKEGGYEYVTRKRKWPVIARKMDYLESKSAPTVLRNHYEKLLFPYDVFQSGLMTGGDPNHEPKPRKSSYRSTSESSAGNKRKSVRRIREEQLESVDYKSNPALKKLQFRAPGPKMAAMYEPEQMKQEDGNPECYSLEKPEEAVVKFEPAESPVEDGFAESKPVDDAGKHARRRPVRRASKKILQDANPELFQDEYVCHMCSQGNDEQYLLLCDGCDASFHTYCLIPPITTIPKGEWRCPKCIAQEYDKPYEIYGFEQSKKEYNLQSFGEMADKFKFDYFKLPPQTVPCDVTEREFWKLVSSMDDEVAIEYGADLHTAVHGSGFPVKENVSNADEEFYAKSKWNLNNLPSLPNSVLSHVNGNISGMKVPWMYVGMCFSSFCWHTEDHWSYSINYLHWGEPKTWYGIPGSFAEKFESVVQEMAPELFEAHPDLLHHLVTIVNPNVLTSKGVPVVRTNQEAGEFVVTFPRSYHAGFNHGYNLAEAVNFATADWLSVGHKCVDHYRRMNRNVVFSHEELICKMAANPENLDLNLAKAIYKDMESIVDEESKLREGLKEKGITEAVREAFELLPDDERQCIACNTTCFLSAVTCQCIDKKLSCIRCAAEHCNECEAQDHLLRHRYTLEELHDMLAESKRRADSFDNWANEVRHALKPSNPKVLLSSLKELVTTAEQSNFPDCELLEELKSAVAEAERCGSVATQLVAKKHRTRNTDVLNSNSVAPSLNLEELQAFSRQLERLPCVIDQAELVQDLMNRVESFQSEAQALLAEPEPEAYKLKQLLDTAIALDVDLPEVSKLKHELYQCRWIQRVRNTLRNTQQVSLALLRALLDESSMLTKKQVVEMSVKQLLDLVNTCEEWELKAKVCLQARPRHLMSSVKAIVKEASLVPVYLPNISALKEALVKAHDWSSKVDHVQNDEHYPYLEVLEALVMRGRPIPVRLEHLPQMESQVAAAQAWRDRTARTFLKKNSNFSLLETLTSRKDIGVYKVFGKQRKRKEKDREKEKEVIDLSSLEEYIGREPDIQSVVFREAKQKELQEIRELRKKNMARLVDLAEQQPESRQFCVCRKGPDGYMLQCELCKEWFHGACVPLPRTPGGKGTSKVSSATTNETPRTLKYMCPLCYRSRRPRLETILSLLVSLQKLPVRLAEGEALQSLTECAMNWQDRVRQLLVKGNIAKVWRKISVEDAPKEPASHLPPVAPVVSTATLLQQNMALVLSRQTQKTLLVTHVTAAQAPSAHSSVLATSSENGGSNMEIDVVGTSGQDGGSNGIAGGDEGTPKQEENGNAEDAMEVEDSTKLSQTEFEELEELMMEGDTLEVTLDETDNLWKMVLNQRKHGGEKTQLLTPKKVDKEKKKRKRKKNEENPKSSNDKDDAVAAGEKVKRKRSKKLGETGKNEKSGEKKPRKYGRGRCKRQEDIVDVEGDDDDDDDDDDDEEEEEEEEACLARPCKRPSSDEVDWVQCDTCEQWYHNLCVGITAKKATELDSYVCPYCKIPPPSTSKEAHFLEIASAATSPDSNVDVVSTTPCTTTPQSPRSPTTKQNTGSDVKLDQPMPELPAVPPASATQPRLTQCDTSEVKEPIVVVVVKE